ncbi:UvrB/UvrC motif-containing protein [Cohnella boryungensis]|uniref:UvrB/UvrC motif-containing protein n=1 Tax=Cohnella boryungensis TaxID=768479 RepID=A0ABV8SBN0_9BACL
MQCQDCGKRPASLHFTKFVNGEKTELHICEPCAREKGEQLPGAGSGFSIHNLLSGILDFEPSNASPLAQQPATVKCECCGMTFAQFSKLGRFGCSNCYKIFSERLDPLLKRVHGSTVHVGKVPKRAGGHLKTKREIDRLKKEMRGRIEREDFESAAQLRDRIRELENEMSG